MSEQSSKSSKSSKSSSTTIFACIIILVLVVLAVIIIYYVFNLKEPVPFPDSPFNYGDTVQICPAVFTQNDFTTKDIPQNQYLTVCESSGCNNCFQPVNQCGESTQHDVCTVTFTGNKEHNTSKWILNQWYSSDTSDPRSSAKQDFPISKYGNRFYLQNASASNINEIPKLMTYLPFNGVCDFGSSITFPVTGNSSINTDRSLQRFFDSPFVVYFLPTTQPDLYYILFPGNQSAYSPPSTYPNTMNTNDGILSLRPYAPPSNSGYNPWNGQIPNSNGPLTNELKVVSPDSTAISTNIPEIFLFKITKA